MNKILTFLIIAMLVLSAVPFVAAENPVPVSASLRPALHVEGEDNDTDDDSDEEIYSNGDGSISLRDELRYHDVDDDDYEDYNERVRELLSDHASSESPKFQVWRVEKVLSSNPNVPDIHRFSENATRIFLRLTRAEQKRVLELTQEQAENKLGEYYLKAVEKALMYRSRTIPVSVMTEARERLQESQEEYDDTKDELDEVKQKFEQAKLGRDDDLATEHAKQYMLKTADLVISALKRIQHSFEGNDDLSEEDVNSVLLEINETIQEMEDAKSEVDAAQTKQDVLDAGKVILQTWRRSRIMIQKHAALLINSKLGDTIQRIEDLESKLDCTLQNMEEQGIDISDIEERVTYFSEEVYIAKEKHRQAMDLLDQAEEDDSLIEDARALIEESKAHIENAHEILKQIVRDIKAAGGEIIECDEPELEEYETYVVEEDDDDDEEEETEEEDEEVECETDEDCGPLKICPNGESTYYEYGCNDGVCDALTSGDGPCFEQEPIELEDLCEDNGGVWLEDYSECEYLSQELCEANGGTFNKCASACRHSYDPETICTHQCVLVCEFSA